MCPIILFFYVHIRLTILTAGITKLAKATNITGELIISQGSLRYGAVIRDTFKS